MGDEDYTDNHKTMKLTQGEIDALADRLLARGVSLLLDVQPRFRSDLMVACGCLRLLARRNPDGVEVDVWLEFR